MKGCEIGFEQKKKGKKTASFLWDFFWGIELEQSRTVESLKGFKSFKKLVGRR